MERGSIGHGRRGQLLWWCSGLLALAPVVVAQLDGWGTGSDVASVAGLLLAVTGMALQRVVPSGSRPASGGSGDAGTTDDVPDTPGRRREEDAGRGRLSTVKRTQAGAGAGVHAPAPAPGGPSVVIHNVHGGSQVVVASGDGSRARGTLRHRTAVSLHAAGLVLAVVLVGARLYPAGGSTGPGHPPPAPAVSPSAGPESSPTTDPTPSGAASPAPATPSVSETPTSTAPRPPASPDADPPGVDSSDLALQCSGWKNPDHGVTYRMCIGTSGGRLRVATYYRAAGAVADPPKQMWTWLVRTETRHKSDRHHCPRPVATETRFCDTTVDAPPGTYTAAGGVSDRASQLPAAWTTPGYYGQQSGPLYWPGG
ncbi:hypothetical protein ACF08M_19295 [Streptomyces sp. NPDC015032]|uniref:hypothetical protein n=1 Tax=Streptomyces sp. NPDC015032 TaxID=3364937 RepID=UPI0037000BCB